MNDDKQWIVAGIATAFWLCAVIVLLCIGVAGCLSQSSTPAILDTSGTHFISPGLEMLYEGAIEFSHLNSDFTEEEVARYRLRVRCLVVDGASGAVVNRFQIDTGVEPISELGSGIFATLDCPIDIGQYPLGRLYHVMANCVWVGEGMLDINCRPGPDEYVDIGAFVGQGVEFRSVYLPLLTKRR